MKQIRILTILLTVLLSCKHNSSQNKTKQEAQLLSKKSIDFSQYRFHTISHSSEKVTLQKRKKYLLDFWYLECAPCVKDHKKLSKNLAFLNENNIELIGFSIDRNTNKWRTYLKKHKYSWRNYNQFKEQPNLKNDLKITLFPRYYLIDEKGNIEFEKGQLSKIFEYIKNKK